MSTEASDTLSKTLTEKAATSREHNTKSGDEQIQGMSLTMSIESPQLADPAILVVRETHTIRYSREELLKLRDVPLSRVKPDLSYISEVAANIIPNQSETTSENGPRAEAPDHRRRAGDPRERLRKENDGIVLSPQRRSFNSGCFVPIREPSRTNRSHSPLGKTEGSHNSVRDIQAGSRRIGSGRILRDTWDFSEKADGDIEYSYRNSTRGNDRDDKFGDRRSFGREIELIRDKDRRNNRYSDRRRISNEHRDEEPEWFSGGPISQHDTIELRGFDESEKIIPKKANKASKKNQEAAIKKRETQSSLDRKKDEGCAEAETTLSTLQADTEKKSGVDENNEIKASGDDKMSDHLVEDDPFNFDDFLKCDTIPGLLTNGVGGDGDNTKSRFSAWFKRESPDMPHGMENRRNSFQEDHMIKHLLTDITEPSVTIPSDPDLYFAPISPAASTGNSIHNTGPQPTTKVIDIMEMLHMNKSHAQTPLAGDIPSIIKRSQLPGKILSLDELESGIRQNTELHSIKQKQVKKEEDLTAFNRLLAQVSGGHAVTANGPISSTQNTSMTLLEMLSHSQQQDEARMSSVNQLRGGPTSPNTLATQHLSNEIGIKLQQVQNQVHQRQQFDVMNKFVNIGNTNIHQQPMRTSPLQDLSVQQSRELLMRPEAQAILQGLNRGDITPQHIYQQLANPALQPRHREMLHAIIKLQSQKSGMGPSPRVLSPVPPQHHMYSHQQQLRVSPHPPNSMHQRIPSPRELQVHTQNILQRALIKKKLEEQQENYRKKQEMQQRGQSPNNNNNNLQATKSQASPTPLAFTPTSVLRKMTAEKDESKDSCKSVLDGIKAPQGRAVTGIRQQNQGQTQTQWNTQFVMKQPVGRPIVKANANYQPASQTEQFFNQQQHQRLLGQQQQQQQQSPQQQPQQQQQRKSVQQSQQIPYPGHMSHMSYPSNSNQQFSQQLTQQQLRAQHQQHARPSNTPLQQPTNPLHPHNYHPVNQQSNWQQFVSTQNSRSNQGGRGGTNDGDLSPTTTNQLARWFSPDLLERARGGELPSTAGLAQRVLSLEEIERHTAPPVHN